MSEIAKRSDGAGGSRLRMATLAGLALLCACQTITAARGDPADPPIDRQVTPAFRRELTNRVLAYRVNNDRGILPPYRITKGYISAPHYGNGMNFYCVTFKGDGRESNTLVSIFYDKAKNVHVKNVLGAPDAEEDAQWCGNAYPLPEAVGRIFGK